MAHLPVSLLALALLLILPASVHAQLQSRAPAPAVKSLVEVAVVAENLEHPWALAFLPDGRLLVTERPGRLRLIDTKTKSTTTVVGAPRVFASGQGGLLDVVLAPDFAASRTLFMTYAEPRGAGTAGTAIARARLVNDRIEDLTVIFRQLPATSGGNHFGSRLAIGRDGNLFATMGERYQRDRAQDLSAHYGKVIRLTPQGLAPADNPQWPSAGALQGIWSLGHRNPQAAAIHPATGKLWIVEHGARGGDEVNIPLAGKNYGWPVITYGRDYSGASIGIGTSAPGMEQPLYYWDPSIAPSGMAFYTGTRMPTWTGNLFVGALAGQHLARLVLDGERVVAEERLLTDLSERIRDVRQGPDEALYVVTDHPQARVLRVTTR